MAILWEIPFCVLFLIVLSIWFTDDYYVYYENMRNEKEKSETNSDSCIYYFRVKDGLPNWIPSLYSVYCSWYGCGFGSYGDGDDDASTNAGLDAV